MPAVSLDLRRLFLRDRQAGHSIRQIARQYGVSHTGVHRIPIRLEERETLEPKKQRHGPLPSWAGRERELLEAVEATPDATLAELCVGLKMSVSVLDRALRVLKITRKKKTLHAAEQDRPDVREARDAWHGKIAEVPAEKLVFVDETSSNTSMTRTHGRCPVGERLVMPVPHGHWMTLTLVCALRTSGLVADRVLDRPLKKFSFLDWVRECLVPTLQKGDVVVMDDLPIHKCPEVGKLIEGAGARLEYLPKYSPDFNPIERAFGRLKAMLKKAQERTVAGLKELLGELPKTFGPDLCENYIMGCI